MEQQPNTTISVKIAVGLIGIIMGLSVYPKLLNADSIIETQSQKIKSILYPELRIICGCESNHCKEPKQFKDDGTPIIHKNTDRYKSTDFGACQINDYWNGQLALEKGWDYKYNEADNYRMANYLYDQNGTKPWLWSKPLWQKLSNN